MGSYIPPRVAVALVGRGSDATDVDQENREHDFVARWDSFDLVMLLLRC